MKPEEIKLINEKIQAILSEHKATLQVTQGISIVPLTAVESPYAESKKEN